MNTYEEVINYLDNRLIIEEYLNPLEVAEFYAVIAKYLENRITLDKFISNFEETIKFFDIIGLSLKDMLKAIVNWPAIMHSSKDELLKKYLLLGVVSEYTNFNREELLINHPKDFITSFDLVYARVNYFMSFNSKCVTRKDEITRRKLFKATNKEFEDMYKVSKDDLFKMYPVRADIFDILINCRENKEIKSNYESESFGK